MRLSTDTKKVSKSMWRMDRESRPVVSGTSGEFEKDVAEESMKRAQAAC
jgi:hypothetical protein